MSAGRRVREELERLKRENEQLLARVERLELRSRGFAVPIFPPTCHQQTWQQRAMESFDADDERRLDEIIFAGPSS